MLPVLVKLGRNDQAAKTLVFTHLHDTTLYTSSQEDIILIVHATDVFLNIAQNPVSFHLNYSYEHVTTLLIGLQIRNIEQEGEQFLEFTLITDKNTQETKMMST